MPSQAASRDRVMKLNDIADLVMADAGIPAVDAWAMSRHPTGLLHTDNVYLDGMNGKFYSVVVDACVSYMKGIWMAGNRRAEL